jgi:hypothetical protein
LYRAQRAYFEKYNTYATILDSLTGSSIIIENKKLNPILESHKTGYNLSVLSPFSNKILILKEDGKFISK